MSEPLVSNQFAEAPEAHDGDREGRAETLPTLFDQIERGTADEAQDPPRAGQEPDRPPLSLVLPEEEAPANSDDPDSDAPNQEDDPATGDESDAIDDPVGVAEAIENANLNRSDDAPRPAPTVTGKPMPKLPPAGDTARIGVRRSGITPKRIGEGRLVPARLTWKPGDPFAGARPASRSRFRWEVMLTAACITAACGLGGVWLLRTFLA